MLVACEMLGRVAGASTSLLGCMDSRDGWCSACFRALHACSTVVSLYSGETC
jgi:hypothetical protein